MYTLDTKRWFKVIMVLRAASRYRWTWIRFDSIRLDLAFTLITSSLQQHTAHTVAVTKNRSEQKIYRKMLNNVWNTAEFCLRQSVRSFILFDYRMWVSLAHSFFRCVCVAFFTILAISQSSGSTLSRKRSTSLWSIRLACFHMHIFSGFLSHCFRIFFCFSFVLLDFRLQ